MNVIPCYQCHIGTSKENMAYETIATLLVIPTVHNQAYETCFDDPVYAGGGSLAVKSTGTNNRFESLHSLS